LGIGSRRRQKGERTYADDCQDAAGIH
jgi:hypothetical protein